MRNLLALIGAALVAFLAVGWYLDWYHISPKPSSKDGHRSLEIDINSKKIGADLETGVQAGSERIHDLFDGDKKPSTPTPVPPPTGKIGR